MEVGEARRRFGPAIKEILDQCQITDEFVDKELFMVYVATVWGNMVLDPGKSGIAEADLPALHDYLNEELASVVGAGRDITACYEFLVSEEGDRSMARLSVTNRHKEFIHYFARLILQRGELPPGFGL